METNEIAEIEEFYGIEWPKDAKLLYFDGWADWSFDNHLTVFQVEDKYYFNDMDDWNPEECSYDQAIEFMLEMEEAIKEVYGDECIY